jgi:Delta3-Delta2-enoyl-CoA isomerase
MALGPYWNLRVDRYDRVYVITMQKAPENRLNVRFAQEIIKALRDIERELGPDSEGCVITKGNDEKFWCTGLELDEADTNPFANSDGFYPVSIRTACTCLLFTINLHHDVLAAEVLV